MQNEQHSSKCEKHISIINELVRISMFSTRFPRGQKHCFTLHHCVFARVQQCWGSPNSCISACARLRYPNECVGEIWKHVFFLGRRLFLSQKKCLRQACTTFAEWGTIFHQNPVIRIHTQSKTIELKYT